MGTLIITSAAILFSIARPAIAVAIVVGIYSALDSRFETILTSIAILIYATVDQGFRESKDETSELKGLLPKMAERSEPEPVPKVAMSLIELASVTSKLIHTAVSSLIQIIAVWKVAVAIGWL